MAVQPSVPGEVTEEVDDDVDCTPSQKPLRDVGLTDLFAVVNDFAEKMDGVLEDIDTLRKRQDWMGRRHEEAESTRRGQLDCVSERLYNAEKELRQVQKMQEDAVEKANAAFQKHANDVLQDRQHMTNAISQVNQNFEQVSSEMVQNSGIVKGTQNSMNQLKIDMEQFSYNWMSYSNSSVALQNDVGSLHAAVQEQHTQIRELHLALHTLVAPQTDVGSLHATVQEQHTQIQELHLALQAVHDTVTHMTPQTQFLEADSKQRQLMQQVVDLQDQVAEMAHEYAQDQTPRSSSPLPAACDPWLPSAPADGVRFSGAPWPNDECLLRAGRAGGGFREDHQPSDYAMPRAEAQRAEGGGCYVGVHAEDHMPHESWSWPPELRRAYENAHGKRPDEDDLLSRPAARRSERVAFTTSIHDVPRSRSGFERRASEKLS